jgi:hypothetical protein
VKTLRRRLHATVSLFLLSLVPAALWAGSSEAENGDTGTKLAEMAETAITDGRVSAELSRMLEQYVARATREWRDGGGRVKVQEASRLLQTNTERINTSLTTATEAAETMSIRIRESGLLEKAAHLEAAAKDTGARLAARWERERAAREREREQRERDAAERAREQRR